MMIIRAALAVALTLGLLAAPRGASAQRIDTWAAHTGILDLSRDWQRYPGSSPGPLKTPPIVIMEQGRPVLRLETDHESVAIWRPVQIDSAAARRLAWEWRVLKLPEGGDVRVSTRNDQAARVMVLFEGMKAIIYVWDTTAPAGTVVRPETFEPLDRVFMVIRSGSSLAGHWLRERREVYQDYRRQFGETPRRVKAVGLESHSDDVAGQSKVEFGAIGFERQ
jgi:Protein of unknown function (DUF3047)